MMTSSDASTSRLLLCFMVLTATTVAHIFGTPGFVDENSLSPMAKYGVPTAYKSGEWVRIKHSGIRMNRVSPGGRVELECEAYGSPPPSVQWFHNNNPLSEGLEESNSIGGLRFGSVKARMVVDCASSRHSGTYTCVATSGTETAISQSSLVYVQGNNASGLLPSCSHNMVSAPRIVTWSPHMFETIGNDVVLPCVSLGTPPPQVYWIDEQNQLIASGPNDSRYKVLDSGDLTISMARWYDMGLFTCVAESALGRDSVTTFLYPMSKGR